jgi:hypothetical protein
MAYFLASYRLLVAGGAMVSRGWQGFLRRVRRRAGAVLLIIILVVVYVSYPPYGAWMWLKERRSR